MRRFCAVLTVASLFVVSSCSSAPSDEDGGPEVDLTRTHAEAWTTTGWLDVRTLLISSSHENPETGTVFIRGRLIGWRFIPTGIIEGPIKPPENPGQCIQGWLRLEDRSFTPQSEAPPSGAHVPGHLDSKDRLFYPSSRAVLGVNR